MEKSAQDTLIELSFERAPLLLPVKVLGPPIAKRLVNFAQSQEDTNICQ